MATPHPETVIAFLSSIIRNIEDAVDGSIAATGAPPSTEEEAFRQNQARDRGIAGAFDAASTFGPGAPQFLRTGRYIASRPTTQALEGRVPGRLSGRDSANLPGPAALPSPERLRPNSSGWPSRGGSVPRVPPPAAGSAPSGGLLARLRELDVQERLLSANNIAPVSPERDPNFRRLSRIVARPLDAASAAMVERPHDPNVENQAESPANRLTYSEWLAKRKKSYKESSKPSRNESKSSKEENDEDDDDFCTKRKNEEQDECSRRWRDKEFADKSHYWGCKERAVKRWDACNQNGGLPPSWELPKWSMDPDEEVYFETGR